MEIIRNLYTFVEFNAEPLQVIAFQCPHCGQKFDNDKLDLAIFLYGAIFLSGKGDQYAGTTCPCCLNTLLFIIGGNIHKFFISLSLIFIPGGSQKLQELKYYSSASVWPQQKKALEGIDTMSTPFRLGDNINGNFNDFLTEYLSEQPEIEENRLCSYIRQSSLPIGPYATVFWYKSDDIPAILKIENDRKIKIFPRYYPTHRFLDQLECFCWDYYTVDQLNNGIIEHYEQLKNSGLQFDTKIEEKDLNAPSRFFEILLSDFEYTNIPDPNLKNLKMINRIDAPFIKIGFPEEWSENEYAEFKRPISDEERAKIIDELRSLSGKSYVHAFLKDKHPQFISDYTELLSRIDFSYGSYRDLQTKYLHELYECAHGESLSEEQYAFYPEGDTWTIIFDGKAIRGLRNSGFKYIYHLLRFPDQVFHTIDLNQVAFDPDLQQKTTDLLSGEGDSLLYSKGKSLNIHNDYEVNDKKTRDIIRKSNLLLRNKIAALDPKKDRTEIDEITRQLNVIQAEMLDKAKNNNNRFANEVDTEVGTICQAIRRALLEIRGDESHPYYDFRKKVHDHFYTSLKPINSPNQRYCSMKGIRWGLG